MTDALNGWQVSASAWIANMENGGDFGRVNVLDGPMLDRVRKGDFKTALDVGCGEGRFCRMLRNEGIEPTGVEPAKGLLEAARSSDPEGRYIEAIGENLPFPDGSFDLVVSYLTLIDIDGLESAIAEMERVLKSDGVLLIANLTSFSTAGHWITNEDGSTCFEMDSYMDPRADWVSWRGISVRNWHRPLSHYMQLLIASGLRLTHFDEPTPIGTDSVKADQYRRCPYFHIMEWKKA